ncbi:hypothetical protein HYR69_11825 [Candidatus Sumerlaeota bacterium]|nr:hypothetical protein [Candidatus Sumerlaeota bacterium]
MKSLGWRIFPLLVLTGVYLAASGCSKQSQEPAGGAAGPVQEADLQKYIESPHLALDGTQDEILQINLNKMRSLSFYAQARDAIFENPDRKSWLDGLRKHLGMDPFEKIDRLIIGLKEPLDLDDPFKTGVLIFVGDFSDPKGFMEGLRKFALERYFKSAPQPVESDYQKFKLFSIVGAELSGEKGGRQDYHGAFPSPKLLVLSRSLELVTSCLDVMKGTKPSITANPEWQDRLAGAAYTAVVWGMGKMPATVNERIKKEVETEPELQKLFYLYDSSEFNISFSYNGREYLLNGAFTCKEMYRSKGLRDNLEDAVRRRNYLPKLIARFAGEGSPRIPVWQKFIGGSTFSVNGAAATMELRKSKEEMEAFVKDAIHPPDVPKAPTGGTDSADPFK